MESDLKFYEGAAATLVFFGNVGLTIPYAGAKSGEFTAMILAFFVSVALYYLTFRGLNIYKRRQMNKTAFNVIGVMLAGFSLYVLFQTVRHFTGFVADDVLINKQKIYIVAAFIGICLYAFYKKPAAITKFALPSLVFIVLAITVLFFLSFDNFDKSHILSAVVPRSGDFALRSLKYLYVFFVSPMVYPVFSAFFYKKPSFKTELAGIMIGMSLLAVCFSSAVLTFSLGEASRLQDAYSKSVSVISVGELFTRMEGIGYFVFFFAAFVKAVVSAFAVKAVLFSMNIKKSREITAFLVVAAGVISLLL